MRVLEPSDLPHYTYEDYRQWEGRWELIEGIPYSMTPSPSILHQYISQKIARILDEALEHCPSCQALLPVDWKISEDTVVQPDNLVLCYPATGQYLTRAPSVIFEILAPSTRDKDEKLKFRLYEQQGVAYYCIVDPEQLTIRFFELLDGRYVDRSEPEKKSFVFQLPDCEWMFDWSGIRA